MSLRGRTVLVTRAVDQAPELADLLTARGARVVALPTLIIAPPADPGPLERAARDGRYDLIAFVSHNAAERLCAVEGFEPGAARLAAVGSKTAAVLRTPSAGSLRPVLVPAHHHGAALLALLVDTYGPRLAGLRVLVPRAPEGRTELIDGLSAHGARVDAPEAYRLVHPPLAAEDDLRAAEAAEVLTFLSGRALEGLLAVMPEARARALLTRARVAVIGPVAAAAAARLGVRVDVVPPAATVEALVAALDEG